MSERENIFKIQENIQQWIADINDPDGRIGIAKGYFGVCSGSEDIQK
ncbi:hypothetical protein ACFL35_14360 [Candidatus Riflebacteria bacterium]